MKLGELSAESQNLSLEQQEVVRETLRLIIASKHFIKSKRYPALLEYTVLHTLDGNTSELKERNIGVDVFGRPHDYDPGADPIVRMAAGEVRRRIALYFSEHPEAPVQICLPLGGYTAEFRFQSQHHAEHAQTEPEGARCAPTFEDAPLHVKHSAWRLRIRIVAAITALLVLVAGCLVFWHYRRNSVVGQFWGPVLENDIPALIVVGRSPQVVDPARDSAVQTNSASEIGGGVSNTAMGNAIAAAQICSIFREYGRNCEVTSEESASLTSLRSNSVVLVGALDNPWTSRLLTPLRYNFEFGSGTPPSARTRFIVDQTHPDDDSPWKVGADEPVAGEDYAIVARFHSNITDGTAVVAAGLSQAGTTSAGDFLSA